MKKIWNKWIQPNKTVLSAGLLISLTVFRIFLFLSTPLAGAGDIGGDDWNLLNHAWQMMQGNWLGNWQDNTLAYGVSFPFFIMLCNKLCIPYMMAVALLYIGSILFFLHSWKNLIPSSLVRKLFYVAFLYSPVMMTTYTAQRAWDLTLVPSFIFYLLGLGYLIYRKRKEHLLYPMIPFSLFVAFFLYLRKTNYWLLPLIAGFLIWMGICMKKEKLTRKIRALFLPPLVIILTGLVISLLNFQYYGKFKVYESVPSETAIQQATPSGVLKDTLYTGFHLSANQMTDIDTHLGSGTTENLRFIESITGSRVLYPNTSPLQLNGWAFPTDDSANLELAVIDNTGQPVSYAEFENSEDIYLEHMEYAASRVSRFTLNAPATEPEQVSLAIYINGEQIDRLPLEKTDVQTKDYYLSLENVEVHLDPALFTTQKAAKVSKIFLMINKILGIPAIILTLISYIGISSSLKSGNKIFQRWIFLTGSGLTALFSIILNCLFYPSQARLDPGAYSSGAWTLTQIFMTLCIIWFLKPLKLGKKTQKNKTA